MPIPFSALGCTALPLRLARRTLQPIQQQLLSSAILYRHPHWSSQLRNFATMPPKQATLGYVKSSQTTLGCEEYHQLRCVCE